MAAGCGPGHGDPGALPPADRGLHLGQGKTHRQQGPDPDDRKPGGEGVGLPPSPPVTSRAPPWDGHCGSPTAPQRSGGWTPGHLAALGVRGGPKEGSGVQILPLSLPSAWVPRGGSRTLLTGPRGGVHGGRALGAQGLNAAPAPAETKAPLGVIPEAWSAPGSARA